MVTGTAMSSAASEAFRKCFADLIQAVQAPDTLVCDLYSANVVSQAIVEETQVLGLPPTQIKMKLFNTIGDQINVDADKFQKLLEVLRKNPPLKDMADKLEEQKTLIETQQTSLSPPGVGEPQMIISAQVQELNKDFAYENRQAITAKFAAFQKNVCGKLLKNKVNAKAFRLFVISQFPPGNCIPPPPACLHEIFEAITKHGLWDFLHYSPLVRIIQTFAADDTEMKDWVKTYKKDLRSYTLITTVEKYIEADLCVSGPPNANSPPAKRAKYDPCYCTPVEWKTESIDHSLQYFTELWELFSSRYLMPDSPPTALLDRVRKGCFVVRWLIPSTLTKRLIERVLTINTDFLQQHYIVKVTVGDVCIYEEVTDESTTVSAMAQQIQGQFDCQTVQSITVDRENREGQIRKSQEKEELQQEGLIAKPQQGLLCKKKLQEENQHLRQKLQKKDLEMQQVQQTTQKIVRQLQEGSQQLADSEQGVRQNLLQIETMIKELQDENQNLQQQLAIVRQKTELRLSWETCRAAPRTMCRGSSVEFDSMAYFKPAGSSQVYSYNSGSEKWSTLPECPRKQFALTVVNGLVTAVGGKQSSNYTNTLLSFKEEMWVGHFRPMNAKRALTAVVCSGKALVVAGGMVRGEGGESVKLTIVEVMDTETQQWSTVSSLPQPLIEASATVCGDSIYLVGRNDQQRYDANTVFTCSLTALLARNQNHSVWHTISDLPVKSSTCVLNGKLLAVGGEDDGKTTNKVCTYNRETDSWEVISQMSIHRSQCLVTVLSDNKLMVVGGEIDGVAAIDKVEIATSLHIY